MHHLNFHHLLLFTTLVREGSLVAAGRVLRLSHSTLSAQIHAFEEVLGAKLLVRQGRKLIPTDTGRLVFRYGEEIFELGREMVGSVEGALTKTAKLRVGIVDVIPKVLVRRLLEPLLLGETPMHLVCIEDTHPRILGQLALHEVDVVLSDAPSQTGSNVRAYNHLLGSCPASFFGTSRFDGLRENFPKSLDGAPMLLPIEGTTTRRALNAWFASMEIRPRIVAEFEDSALQNVMAQEGAGVFCSAVAVEREIEKQYGVRLLGRVPQLILHFYAISLERRIRDPGIAMIFNTARDELFRAPRRRTRTSRQKPSAAGA